MTEKEEAVILAYKTLSDRGGSFTNEDVAKLVEGEEWRPGGKTRISTTISRLRSRGEWPYDDRRLGRPLLDRSTTQKDEDDETVALTRTVNLLNTLNSKSMRKVIDFIKNGTLTFDEMSVLTELSRMYDALDKEVKKRLMEYIGNRFNI